MLAQWIACVSQLAKVINFGFAFLKATKIYHDK